MLEFFSNLLKQIKEFWQKLDKSQRTHIYITSAIVVIAVTIAIIVLTRPSYSVLVSNVNQKEIGEMSSILSENNIWHEITDNGTSIKVYSKDNSKAQIVLAQAGYPKGGITFEDAISMIGITTTESDKKHIWKQQQASEIAKKLMTLDVIEYAEVSLALPEEKVFLTSNEKEYLPTAYVMVKPKTTLTQEQVKAIVMMVSKSVEKLEPENITVVDNNLNLLNDYSEEDNITAITKQEELRLQKARELEEKVYKYFNVGGGFDSFDTLRVVANPYLDFDTLKTQSKLISNPSGMDGGALISREEITEKSSGVEEGGVPGTDTNPGETTAPTYLLGNQGTSNYDYRERRENYIYDETVQEQEKALGYLVPERSSMAISLWYGKRVLDDSKLSDDLINQIKLAASAATGIPVENITVNKYMMAPAEIVQKSTADRIKELVNEYGLFMILLLMIAVMTASVLSMRKKSESLEVAAVESAASLSDIMEPEYEEVIPEPVKRVSLEEKSGIAKEIDRIIKEKPEAVAQLLRTWLYEDLDS